jgi:hypothetical protein
MMEMLSSDWIAQYAIPTKIPRGNGYPTCYKADFADPTRKMIIEVDGESHRSRKQMDEKRDSFLESLGWSTWRVSNARVKELYTTWKQTGFTITSPLEL